MSKETNEQWGKTEEFIKLCHEMKKFFEDRDIQIGFEDTYYGHLAVLIQEKISKAKEEARAEERARWIEEMRIIAETMNEVELKRMGERIEKRIADLLSEPNPEER